MAKRRNGKKKNGKSRVSKLNPIIFIIHLINRFSFEKNLNLIKKLFVLMKSASEFDGSSCSTGH